MKHIRAVQNCTDLLKAERKCESIANRLVTYKDANGYTYRNLREAMPKDCTLDDTIANNQYGKTFRNRYRVYLMRAWHRAMAKTTVESAYSRAINELMRGLGVSRSTAKRVMLERSGSEFYEYQQAFPEVT